MRSPNDRTRGMRMRVGLRSGITMPTLYTLDMRRWGRLLWRRIARRVEFSGVSTQSSTCDMQSRGTRYVLSV